MIIENFLEQDCLVFDNYDDAITVQKILLEQGYCVMMGREEQLWTLNWVWTEIADRNGVIFINRAEYECKEWEWMKKHPEESGE